MQKMIKYPSTEQFKAIVGTILRQYNYVGQDENDQAVYDGNKPKPVIDFTGTVKCHGCFYENTLVTLANGETVAISDVQVGDYVLSYDIDKQKYTPQKVTHTMKNSGNKDWCKLVFDDREIICTKDHQFFTKNRGWVEAQYLTENDEFILDID